MNKWRQDEPAEVRQEREDRWIKEIWISHASKVLSLPKPQRLDYIKKWERKHDTRLREEVINLHRERK